MRKLACLAALLAVTACGDATEVPAEDETAIVEQTPVETVSMAVDGQPSAGQYKITAADGTTYDYTVNEDGTFTSVSSTGETMTGTWTEATPGNYCETVDGTEACYTETIDADGNWTATSDADGSVATVERVES